MVSQKGGKKLQAVAFESYALTNTEKQFILCEELCGTDMDLRRLATYHRRQSNYSSCKTRTLEVQRQEKYQIGTFPVYGPQGGYLP